MLIDLAEHERIDLKNFTDKKTMNFSYDVIAWKKDKFKTKLRDLKIKSKPVK